MGMLHRYRPEELKQSTYQIILGRCQVPPHTTHLPSCHLRPSAQTSQVPVAVHVGQPSGQGEQIRAPLSWRVSQSVFNKCLLISWLAHEFDEVVVITLGTHGLRRAAAAVVRASNGSGGNLSSQSPKQKGLHQAIWRQKRLFFESKRPKAHRNRRGEGRIVGFIVGRSGAWSNGDLIHQRHTRRPQKRIYQEMHSVWTWKKLLHTDTTSPSLRRIPLL